MTKQSTGDQRKAAGGSPSESERDPARGGVAVHRERTGDLTASRNTRVADDAGRGDDGDDARIGAPRAAQDPQDQRGPRSGRDPGGEPISGDARRAGRAAQQGEPGSIGDPDVHPSPTSTLGSGYSFQSSANGTAGDVMSQASAGGHPGENARDGSDDDDGALAFAGVTAGAAGLGVDRTDVSRDGAPPHPNDEDDEGLDGGSAVTGSSNS